MTAVSDDGRKSAVTRRLTLMEALADVLDPLQRTILDVGCGDGALVRHLTGLGGSVIGLEIDEGQLSRARSTPPVGMEEYRVGRGEALPVPDRSTDAIVYSNSFHHLPLEAMAAAMAEAARVLKPDGRLIVVEPIAEGAYFGIVRLVDDETAARAAAYETLLQPPDGLSLLDETVYLSTVRFREFDLLVARVVAVDPSRRDLLAPVQDRMRELFHATGREENGQFAFDQPMRRMTFVRSA